MILPLAKFKAVQLKELFWVPGSRSLWSTVIDSRPSSEVILQCDAFQRNPTFYFRKFWCTKRCSKRVTIRSHRKHLLPYWAWNLFFKMLISTNSWTLESLLLSLHSAVFSRLRIGYCGGWSVDGCYYAISYVFFRSRDIFAADLELKYSQDFWFSSS